MTDTYQKNMTLEEIAANDLEMTKDAIKNANKYHFGNDTKKAVNFVRECLGKTLVRLGVSHPAPLPAVSLPPSAAYLVSSVSLSNRFQKRRLQSSMHRAYK